MIVNQELAKILAESSKTGDNRLIVEVVASSLEKHKTYDAAVKNPDEWIIWAKINPRDSISILDGWVKEGKNVSPFADKFQPDLTPCDSFANALGFAIHLHLKRFLYRNYGGYSAPMHTYSTTPVRNSNSASAPIGQSVINRNLERPADNDLYDTRTQSPAQGSEQEFNSYKSRMLAAIEANNRTELAAVYNEIMAKPDLTMSQKAELRRIYDSAKSAIRNQQRADRQTSKGYDNMASRSSSRAERKKQNVEDSETLDNINEVKQYIKQMMLREMKNF